MSAVLWPVAEPGSSVPWAWLEITPISASVCFWAVPGWESDGQHEVLTFQTQSPLAVWGEPPLPWGALTLQLLATICLPKGLNQMNIPCQEEQFPVTSESIFLWGLQSWPFKALGMSAGVGWRGRGREEDGREEKQEREREREQLWYHGNAEYSKMDLIWKLIFRETEGQLSWAAHKPLKAGSDEKWTGWVETWRKGPTSSQMGKLRLGDRKGPI